MNLPFLNTNRNPQKDYFLSLIIKPFKVAAILFEEEGGKLIILATKEIGVEKEVSELSIDELLAAADKAISSVEPSLPTGASVEKTIFSVPYDWVADGKISHDNLAKLKKLCEDLGLIPMGYLISIEAVVHFLQKKEGAPISAIFVEVTEDKIFLYLVRGGKITEFLKGEIVDGIIPTSEKMLKSIESVDVLPSKIVLLNHKEAANIQQEFLSHTWSSSIPFLHLPQVATLDDKIENEATINGVASQMELEIAMGIKEESNSTDETVSVEEGSASDFGFMKEKDAKDKGAESNITESEGIPKKGKIADNIEDNVETPSLHFQKNDTGDSEKEEVEDDYKNSSLKYPISLATIKEKIRMPNFSLPGFAVLLKGGSSLKLIGILILFVVVGVVFSYVYYNFLLKAEIVVFAEEQIIEDELDAIFSAGGGSNTIPIEIIEEEVEGEENKSATGTEETGETAKGEVTILSSLNRQQVIEKGTVLSSGNIEFILDDNVTIASSSGISDIKSAKGKVTASEIGKEYNLPSNTKFTVDGFESSSLEAKNDSAFAGGTKEEKTVVAEKDLNELLAAVTAKLAEQALSQAGNKISDEEGILPEIISEEVVDHNFSRGEGDEASSVDIAATIRYSIAKYNKDTLARSIGGLTDKEIPDNYSLDIKSSNIEISDLEIDADENSASANLNIKAIYVPKIEGDEIGNKIVGKSEAFAKGEIEKINGVSEVVINFKNALPIFPKILPGSASNISIEFKNN